MEKREKISTIILGIFLILGIFALIMVFPVNAITNENPDSIGEGIGMMFLAIFQALGVVLIYGIAILSIVNAGVCTPFIIRNFKSERKTIKVMNIIYMVLAALLLVGGIVKIILLATAV